MSSLSHQIHPWHDHCLVLGMYAGAEPKTAPEAFLKVDLNSLPSQTHLAERSPEPIQPSKPSTNQPTPMSEEIKNPEIISDEQLEDVAGGTFDNNKCTAGLMATVNIL